MQFPKRVNLVYGNRWTLTKRGGGAGKVDSAPVAEAEKDDNFRRNCDYRWLLEPVSGRDGEYLVRNDHHPRHAVRAGIPLTVERRDRGQINHRWRVAFPDPAVATASSPFHIRSVASGMYLVTEPTGTVMLQKDEPAEMWHARDATGVLMKAFENMMQMSAQHVHHQPRSASELSIQRSGSNTGPSVASTASPTFEASPTSRPQLGEFAGSLADAFRRLPGLGGDFPEFTPYEHLLNEQVELCDGWELPCPAGCGISVEEVFGELFATGTSFVRQYQERRHLSGLEWHPPEPHAAEPWCAAGRLSGNVGVPVLGRRPYEEFQRYLFCREEGQAILACQQVGFLDVGWFMSKVRTETLLFFTQERGSTSVRLRAVAPVPPDTTFKQTQLNGTMEALADFQAVLAERLAGRTAPVANGISSADSSEAGASASSPSPTLAREMSHASKAGVSSESFEAVALTSCSAPARLGEDVPLSSKANPLRAWTPAPSRVQEACCSGGLLKLISERRNKRS